jgi:hypothetical protein
MADLGIVGGRERDEERGGRGASRAACWRRNYLALRFIATTCAVPVLPAMGVAAR